MAEQILPNYLATAQSAYAFGHGQGAQRKVQENQSRLSLLASQAYGAPQDQRAGIVQQAVGIDPDAGFSLDKQLQGGDDAREKSLLNTARLIDQAPPEMKEAIFQRVRPAIEQHLPNLPANYNDQVGQGIKAFIASRDASSANMPTGFRELDMKARAAGLQPGTPEYQQAMNIALGREGRAATGGFGFEKVIGADGRERMGRTNPRTGVFEVYDEASGNFIPMGGGAAINGGPAPTGYDNGGGFTAGMGGTGARVNVDGMPAQQQQQMATAIAAMRQAGVSDSVIDAFAQTAMSQPRVTSAPSGNPALGVSQSPAEKKYSEESGQQRAQLDTLRERGGIEAENAAQKAAAEAQAKTQVEVGAKQGQKARDAQATLGLLDEAERILPSATGGGAGAATDRVAGVLGISTPGAQATAQLNLIAAQLVSKVPRFEGPQSNIDVQFYREAAGDLANPNLPVATRLAALRTMRALSEKAAGAGGGSAPAPGTVQDGYRFKGGNPADPNSWERL